MLRIVRKTFQVGRAALPYLPGKSRAPEGFRGAPEIDPEKCTGCGQCLAACPTAALSIHEDRPKDQRTFSLNYGDCIFCGLCEPACPYEAVSFKGRFELAQKSKDKLVLNFPFKLSACEKDPKFISGGALPRKETPNLDQDFSHGDFSSKLSLEGVGRRLKEKIGSLFGRSLHIREVDAGSCNGCEAEITNLSNPVYDAERFGIHFVASPRHADLILVTGPVTRPMELALVKTYAAAPSPKLVVACGGCAISGGLFRGSYAVTGGADRCVPVDVYVPGCPPRPEAILYGIFLALDRIN